MVERRGIPISDRLARYLLPIVIGFCAYLLQQSYMQIKETLQRIESRQSSDQLIIAELRTRIYALEMYSHQTAPGLRGPPPQPASMYQF